MYEFFYNIVHAFISREFAYILAGIYLTSVVLMGYCSAILVYQSVKSERRLSLGHAVAALTLTFVPLVNTSVFLYAILGIIGEIIDDIIKPWLDDADDVTLLKLKGYEEPLARLRR